MNTCRHLRRFMPRNPTPRSCLAYPSRLMVFRKDVRLPTCQFPLWQNSGHNDGLFVSGAQRPAKGRHRMPVFRWFRATSERPVPKLAGPVLALRALPRLWRARGPSGGRKYRWVKSTSGRTRQPTRGAERARRWVLGQPARRGVCHRAARSLEAGAAERRPRLARPTDLESRFMANTPGIREVFTRS